MTTILLSLAFVAYLRGAPWGFRAAARRDAECVVAGEGSHSHPGHTLFYRERALFWMLGWPLVLIARGFGALLVPLGGSYRRAFDAANDEIQRHKQLTVERKHAEEEIDRIIREAKL